MYISKQYKYAALPAAQDKYNKDFGILKLNFEEKRFLYSHPTLTLRLEYSLFMPPFLFLLPWL